MKSIITRNIPDELHKAFKIKCATQGISLNQAVLDLMTTWTNEPKRSKKDKKEE